jgi:hypothetical protein
MATFEIHAGDFPSGKHTSNGGVVSLSWQPGDGFLGKSIVLIGQVDEVSVASEEEVKRAGGTIGWGVAGPRCSALLVCWPVSCLAARARTSPSF